MRAEKQQTEEHQKQAHQVHIYVLLIEREALACCIIQSSQPPFVSLQRQTRTGDDFT